MKKLNYLISLLIIITLFIAYLPENIFSAKPRGMFVWNSFDIVLNTNTTPANSTNNWINLFGFCFAPHQNTNKRINSLYISPYKGGTSDTLFDDAGTPNRKQMLRKFIRDAHSKDFKVEAIMGDPSWATPSGKASGLARVQQVIDYNLSVNPNERFDGLLMDIEPVVTNLSGWTGYTDFLSAVKAKFVSYNSTNEPDMTWGDTISPWYDNDAYPYTTTAGPIDRCSVVAIMSYYESGDGIVVRASNEIHYADSVGTCKTRFGVETQPYTPETITFYEEGVTEMENAIAYAESYFNSSTSLEEVFIHHFRSYSPNQPYTGKIPSVAPSTYYTNRAPVVRILTPNGGENLSGNATIRWDYQDRDGNSALLDIYLSINGGNTWTLLTNNLPSSSTSYTFNTALHPDSSQCIIKIVARQSSPALSSYDKSDAPFAIINNSANLEVTKNIDISSNTFYGGAQNRTVMAINIDSGLSNRTLTGIKVKNIGTLSQSYITAVKLWFDRGSVPYEWDSDDLYVATLSWNGTEWQNNSITFNTNLKGGKNFIITIDISQGATSGTFKAQISKNWVTATGPSYGPSSDLINAYSQTIKQSYLLIDDFSSQAQYGNQLNDFAIGGETGEYTDDDGTMRSPDFVTNDGTNSYLILRWKNDGSSYWYTVLDDDGPATDGISGFPATNYQGVKYDYLVMRIRGNASAAGVNFGIVLRDYANTWKRKYLTDYLPSGLTTTWTTVTMPLQDWAALGVNLGALKSIAFDSFPTTPVADLYVDEIGLKASIPKPLEVTKLTNYPDGPFGRLYPGDTNKEVLYINIKSSKSGDKLKSIKIKNSGTATPSEISAVKLWYDKNNNKKWDINDVYICNLNWNASLSVYSNTVSFASNISGAGRNFIITVNLNTSAVFDHTFEARILANYITTESNLIGPENGVGNSVIHIFNNRDLIDDFSSQSRYANQCNARGFYTDDDGTMGWGNDFVTNEDYLVLRWDNSSDYWFSVINDITGFDTSLYSNIGFDAKSTINGLNFKVTLRDINNNWQQRDVTNYISGGVKTNWKHIDIKISDFNSIDRTKLKTFTIEGFSTASGTLYLDNLKFNSGVNVAPQISITKVTQTNNGTGKVYIRYTGIDSNNDLCSYVIAQFSTNELNWYDMTKATSDPQHSSEPLQFKASGTNLCFVWDSASNLPNIEDSTVWIRLQVNDGSLNSSIVTNGPILIDNKSPDAVILISPSDNKLTNNNKPQFNWYKASDLSGIKNYKIEISLNTNFSSGIVTNVITTNFMPLKLDDGTNYWRVRAIDNKNNIGSLSARWKIIIDTTPPSTVTLLKPANNLWTNIIKPTFTWFKASDNLSGISNYKIEISKDSNFSSYIETNYTTTTNYTITTSLSNGTYFWRVCAFDKIQNKGGFSQIWRVNIDTNKPYVTSPVPNNNSTNNSLTINFSWTGIDTGGSGIKNYEIYIDNDSNTNNGWEINKITNNNSYTYTFNSNGTYYWKVRASDNAGNTGLFSVWKITINTNVAIPSPFYPVATYISNSYPTFIWSDVSANFYQLQVSTNSNFINNIINESNITSTNYTSTVGFTIDRRYFWRVRAKTSGWQSFSSIVYFDLDKTPPSQVTLSSPDDNSYTTNRTPVFNWNPSSDSGSGIKNYVFQLSSVSNFSSVITIKTLTQTVFTQTDPLSDNKYFWRVRAIDKAGNEGNWSSVWRINIDTTPPSRVTLISPYSNSITTNTKPNLLWFKISDATNYILVLGTNTNFISPVISKTLNSTNYTLPGSLTTNRYYWKVRAIDKAGNKGEWSSIWNFEIIFDNQAPVITLLIPSNVQLNTKEPYTIRWSASDNKSGIDRYILNIDGSLLNIGTSTNYTISFDKIGQHIVKIIAYDRVGNSSEVQITFVVSSGVPLNKFGFEKNPVNLNENQVVKIYYNVETDIDVKFEIYTITGLKIKEIIGKNGEAYWDGTNESGKKVASGIYLVIMKQNGKIVKDGGIYKLGVLK